MSTKLEKLKLATKPNKELILEIITRISPSDADDLLVEFTSYMMRERLRDSGNAGWNTAQCENADLKKRLLKNAEQGDWLDVLNLAAMLYARTQLFNEVLLPSTE